MSDNKETTSAKVTKAFAPASIGNVSLGFDLLGAALQPIDGKRLGDWVEVKDAEAFSLTVDGTFADRLPAGSDNNIVTKCFEFFQTALADANKAPLNVAMHLHKALPIGSGLGSSASSIVAAFYALNEHANKPFDEDQLLTMMGELEGQISGSIHYDNVAPSYLGGLVLMTGEESPVAVKLPCFDNWYWVVCYSGISVSTAEARRLLPQEYSLSSTLDFGRQLSVFVHSLYAKDEALAAKMMTDVIAEEHRKVLLPRFDDAREAANANNALAFGISGSGPTVFAVARELDDANAIKAWLEKEYIQNEDGFSHVCQLSTQGTQVLPSA
ncbi:homoserine kinase [Alteromonas sp. W364]|jgi:homoserine kinase|uniref:homoserine kinase n=1 Tax=Alteromonas sp. W364 TaxID=3075610 RepID=UPI0028854322|nr:homoserine kinase [Alteromonas sp. W364]MDT0627507.1 homoserine kinase [Alteromonas sp. W364]